MAVETKQRILDTTAELFRRQGFNGTGLKQIVAEANAPFGSIYHFFPGGKEQLGAEVITSSGRMYQDLIETVIAEAPDIVTGVRDCFTGAAAVLVETGYADACPIETVALEVASTNETLRLACAGVFESWTRTGTRWLEASGIPRRKARELTLLLISALEGAFVLCRATQTTEPLEAAGAYVASAVREALLGAKSAPRSPRARTRPRSR